MSTVVDHITAPCVLRILRAFCDLAGQEHAVGSEWHVARLEFCFVSKQLTFHLLDHGLTRSVAIDITDAQGPKIGRMREWFELLGNLPAEEMSQPRSASSSGSSCHTAAQPDLGDFATLVGLMKRHEWEAARVECSRLANESRYDGEALQNFAGELEGVAARLAGEDREAGIWLYDLAIGYWHAWGSFATSGGDGAARMPYIKGAHARRTAFLASRK